MGSKHGSLRSRVHGRGAQPLTVAFAAVALAGSLLATGQASASTVNSSQSSIVDSAGGMVAASASHAGVPSPNVSPAKLPSCGNITYKGNAGAIHVQTNSKGYLQWGIYMYNPKLDAGPWVVAVYVANKKVDSKKQDYAPHGSLPPAKAKKGKTFHITATHHANSNGKNYGSVPNECIIP
jgi:hypothetical protein